MKKDILIVFWWNVPGYWARIPSSQASPSLTLNPASQPAMAKWICAFFDGHI